MLKKFITQKARQTQKLGELLAQELTTGQVICLSGDLGAGKTTFSQGFLKGLKIKGPHTSPTFVVIKHYKSKFSIFNFQFSKKQKTKIQNIYHFDAYRVKAKDILDLGWEEIVNNKSNIVLVEWAERIKKIIPPNALWINFQGLSQNERKITFQSHP